MGNGASRVSRRLVLAGMLAGAAEGALAAPLGRSLRPRARPSDLRNAAVEGAEALISQARLGGKVAFVVADARTGKVLEAKNPLLPMPPASTAKTITTLYALDTLGAGFRFRTQLVATGPLRGGIVQGDLVLVGSGDPVLDTDDLGELAASLKAAGVREVSGGFYYFDRTLPRVRAIDPGQPAHVGYNPAVSGLNLNFNRVHFEWKRASGGWDVTMDARTARLRPEVSIARMHVVNRQAPVYTYADRKGVDDWTVASAALGKGGARWLPVRRPGAYAADVFRTLARAHGIVLDAAEAADRPPQGTVMAQHVSPELRDILQDMLKYSTNMTAEVVGMTASRARGQAPSSLAASAQTMTDWFDTALGGRKSDLVDHSGLEPASRVSATDMVRALVKVGPDGPLRPILKEIPMRDAEGRLLRDSKVKIRAKTGTLNFVSALTGYVTGADGRELAFAMYMADEDRRDGLRRAERERPPGGHAWLNHARLLQVRLIDRWTTLYGS